MTTEWPKTIKLQDVVDALEELDERVAYNTARIDGIIADQQAKLAELEHFAEAHQAGAIERQQELDTVRADLQKQRWHQRLGRRP